MNAEIRVLQKEVSNLNAQISQMRVGADYEAFERIGLMDTNVELLFEKNTEKFEECINEVEKEKQFSCILLREFDALEKIAYEMQLEFNTKKFLEQSQEILSEKSILNRKKTEAPSVLVQRQRFIDEEYEKEAQIGIQKIRQYRCNEAENLLSYENYLKKVAKVDAVYDQNEQVIEPEKEIITWVKRQDVGIDDAAERLRQSVVETLANLQDMAKLKKDMEEIELPSLTFE